jgi:hypothetical protein
MPAYAVFQDIQSETLNFLFWSNSEAHLIFVSVRCQDKLTFTRNNPAITPSTSPPTQQRTLVLFGSTVATGL